MIFSLISPSFSWGKFSHVLRLDQSHVSKNICWIMIPYILPKSIREKRGGLPALFTKLPINKFIFLFKSDE